MVVTLNDLRRFTVARNFFKPTTLKRALHRMGFVQADPIRSPARAQDLILRHRVKNYLAGDLERRYATLEIEEDFFIIYGFVTRSLQTLMLFTSARFIPPLFFGKSSRQFPKTSTRFPSGLPRETNLIVQFAGLTQWDSPANLENKSRRKFDRRR